MVQTEFLEDRWMVVKVDPRFGWGEFISPRQVAQLVTIFGIQDSLREPSWQHFEEKLAEVTSPEEQAGIPIRIAEFGLSPVEYVVAMLDVCGLQYKQIARALGITESPVKTHASHCLSKIGVGSSIEMAVKGMAVGLFPKELVRRHTPPIDLEAMGRLSERELQVLKFLAQGEDNDGIAKRLGIASQTVRNHVYRICGKFDFGQTRMSLVVNFALDGRLWNI